MAWTWNDVPDQLGHVAVVTGANSGLGLEVTRALLYAPKFVNTGAPVRRVLLGRSVRRAPASRLWSLSEQATGTTFDVASLAREHAG